MGGGGRNSYAQLLAWIFEQRHSPGDTEVPFDREDIVAAAAELGLERPKNVGDVVYSFRYRRDLPPSVTALAPPGTIWMIVTLARAKYAFRAVEDVDLTPDPTLEAVEIPDGTPSLIARHALNSEQALLARIRYNRLIDLFTGIVCFSLQNHVRATVGTGVQIETDEVYLGVDRGGQQFVVPVEAKGGSDRLSMVQMNQDLLLAKEKFPALSVRLVGVQFLDDGDIHMFLFGPDSSGSSCELLSQARFRLVASVPAVQRLGAVEGVLLENLSTHR